MTIQNETQHSLENENLEHLNQRIEKVENLLEELEKRKKEWQQQSPPDRSAPMEKHVMDLAERAGLAREDIIHRTRQKNGGRKKIPSGYNKDGVIKINRKLSELQERIRELERGNE